MMKKLFLCGLLLLLVTAVLADSYTIGSGTTASALNPYYGLYNYGWCKSIYTSAEINAAGLTTASDIIGIGFYVGNTPANYLMENQSVYLRHTTASIYETTDNTYPGNAQFDQVFNGNLTYNGSGWHYITFTNPFSWNGTENLEFLYENNDTDCPTGYPTYRYTSSTPNYMTVYKGDDASFPSGLTGTRSYTRANIMLVTPSTTAPNPATLLLPLDGGTLISPATHLSWSPGSIWPTGYRLFLGTNSPPTNVIDNLDMGNVTTYNPTPDLELDTTYFWQVIPYNTYGQASDCPIWSFTTHGDNTITSLPYFQHWDSVTAPALPFDWTSIVQASVTTALVVTYATSPYSPPNSARLYNGADTAANVILVGPQIANNLNVNEIRVRFQGKGSTTYHLFVGVMTDPTDPATFVMVQDLNVITNWNEYIVSLTGYNGTGRYIAFKHGCAAGSQSLYVDDVNFEQISPNDLACIALSGNSTPSVNLATIYSANIFNWGTAAQSTYTVKLFDANNVELATAPGITIAAGTEVSVPLSWTPTVQGPTSLYAKVFLTGDINPTNDQSPNLNVAVQPPGAVVVTIGEGNLAEGVPLEFYYKNSIHQSLFYQSELNVFGLVTALTFYNNFVTDLPNKPCKFWLGQTNLSDLSSGWITTDLTLVYDGTINFPTGVNTITIPLQTPFTYTAGNLILYANRPMDTAYFSTNDNFQAQTVGANRARKLYSDSVTYDPMAPSAAGTLSGTFPKTSFTFITDGYAALQGSVTSGGNPVADVNIAIDTTTSTQTTNAAGTYIFSFVLPVAYTVTASKLGFESQTLPVTLVADETTTLNFNLTAASSVIVSGTVVGSDQPTVGLPEAELHFSGILNYDATTNAQGQFSIPGVLSGNTYTYQITKAGYQPLSGSITVAGVDYNMGTLVLNEIALPPGPVVATENIAQTQVTVLWSSPSASPPEDDFEINDGGWVPSSNWTNPLGDFQWTNTYNVANYVVGGYPTSEFPPPTAHSGTGLWGTVLYAPYTNAGGFSYLTKEFSFAGINNPQLRFWSWNNSFGNWDYGQVAVNGNIVWGPAWDTTPIEWEEIVIDLSAYANLATVSIQFQQYTTTVVNYAGWYIDDVYVGAAQTLARAYTPPSLPQMFNGLSEVQAAALAVANHETNYSKPAAQTTESRTPLGYKVWRLLAADQANEALWTLMTPTTIVDTTYIDTVWAPLPSGVYKYAVKTVYTSNVLSVPVFSNELHKGMMGVFTGTVTEFGTNVPISGATITAGDYTGTSDAQGLFSFLVYAGTYNVTCTKPGYQAATQAGVVIVGTQTTTQNFVLTEITLPPAGVQAVEAGANVNVTWMAPGTAGGEWLSYDGPNDDSIGTGAAADFDVAIRFPATALADYQGMSLYALKLWPAQAGTFSARVWTGGTATAPATMVADQAFTPTLDVYNTVTLTNPVAVPNGELWFGYRCNVTTGYPAGCDAGPQVEGFGNMMYWQSAWTTLTVVAPTLTYNWNIQGYVGYSAPTSAPLITYAHVKPTPTTTENRISYGTLGVQGSSAGRHSRSVYSELLPKNTILHAQNAWQSNRTLTGYKVWRLIQGQETNEGSWITLTPDPITATACQDPGWNDLPDGTYRWSVKAIYTGGAASLSAFSNPLSKITQIGTIAGIVRNMQNQPIQGATVTCGDVTATTNNSGAYSMQLLSGTHSVTASHASYNSVTHTGIVVITGQTTTVNFQLPTSTNLLGDDFEVYPNFAITFAPWTLVDVDQSTTYGMTGIAWDNAYAAQAYIIFNQSATVPPVTDLYAHSGSKIAACFASTTPPNNDWLISPQVTDATSFKFWAKSYTAEFGLERFKVGVSTTGTNPNDFTIISGANYVEAPIEWTEYTYNLTQTGPVYIGIQCISNDAFIFCVDDVLIGGSDGDDPVVSMVTTELHNNFPNPFNPETTITYSVKGASPVSIEIYNVKGQLVKTLVNDSKEAGTHSVVWNGMDGNGRAVSSGVYYYKMNAGKYSSTRKMILMK